MRGLIILLAAILLLVIYMVVQYNWLVSLRNHIRESWSDVETE